MTDAPFYLPESLVRNRTVMGGDNLTYLHHLSDVVASCKERWNLQLGAPFPRLSFNYAAPATLADGTAAVLKICPPDAEYRSEVEALRLFDGRGAVRLLAEDPAEGVLLLERVEPGVAIIELEADDEATGIALDVVQQLWRTAPHEGPFPTLADWFERAYTRHRLDYGGSGPIPETLFDRTEALVAELLATSGPPMLLHGDLNYGNVVSAQREPWLAIDPKGILGDPVFDTAILLHDPDDRILAAPSPLRFLARRVDQIVERTGFPRDRVIGWGIAYAVLSAVWTAEDHAGGWDGAIACAEVLSEL